jgi:excisionase family DNA binding protein
MMIKKIGVELVDIETVAATLMVSKDAVRRFIRNGRLAKVKLGARTLIPAADVERFVRENTTPAADAR